MERNIISKLTVKESLEGTCTLSHNIDHFWGNKPSSVSKLWMFWKQKVVINENFHVNAL